MTANRAIAIWCELIKVIPIFLVRWAENTFLVSCEMKIADLDLLQLPQFMSLFPNASITTIAELAGFSIFFHFSLVQFSLLYCHQINL